MKSRMLMVVSLVVSWSLMAFCATTVTVITQSASTTFPIKIDKPGSYRLGSDLNVPANVDGIEINATDVTLDLNGYTVRGPVTCAGKGASLSCQGTNVGTGIRGTRENTSIRNGTVRGFGVDGIELLGDGAILEDLHVSENSYFGIIATGAVWRCTATRNKSGMYVGAGTLNDSVATGNQFDGFVADQTSINGNTAVGNGEYGLAAGNSSFSNNTFFGNSLGPIFTTVGNISGRNNMCDGSRC